jgi:hypothetical protein
MTRALDPAIAKLSELPADEQDRIVRWRLGEVETVRKQWVRLKAEFNAAIATEFS